jgi:hypothetical protein
MVDFDDASQVHCGLRGASGGWNLEQQDQNRCWLARKRDVNQKGSRLALCRDSPIRESGCESGTHPYTV